MQVFQTCGVPPSLGKIILPIRGCTRNSKKALTNNVNANSGKAKGHLRECERFSIQPIIVEERWKSEK